MITNDGRRRRNSPAGLSQFEGAGRTDDSLGAIGLFSPNFDLGAHAIALAMAFDNAAMRRAGLFRPQDVDEAQMVIVTAAKDLAAKGEITIAAPGEADQMIG